MLADLELAHRHGDKVRLGLNLIERPRRPELDTVGRRLAEAMGLAYCPLMQVVDCGGSVAERLSIALGRFAMMASVSASARALPLALARTEQGERHRRSRQR
ncbi:hypothetical protein [Bradyrhizobium icense]